VENPPRWWYKMSCWRGLEPKVCAGPSCSLPAPRAAGHVCLPHIREKEEARVGLSGTGPSLSHIPVLCGFRRRVALVGKDGCFVLLAGNEWTGQHFPAPWLKLGCLMLLSDVVSTSPETLQLLDPKNREL